MTLTLTPITETRLQELAARRGQAPEAVIDALIEREIMQEKPVPAAASKSGPNSVAPMIALFAEWAIEDATDDPEEIARRQQEGDELLTALQANHLAFRVPVGLDEGNE